MTGSRKRLEAVSAGDCLSFHSSRPYASVRPFHGKSGNLNFKIAFFRTPVLYHKCSKKFDEVLMGSVGGGTPKASLLPVVPASAVDCKRSSLSVVRESYESQSRECLDLHRCP